MLENISLRSFNCRGLGDGRKRRAIFQWLRNYHSGIVLLQETHSSQLLENQWRKEWEGDVYFNHGTNLACGVAILMPKNLVYTVNDQVIDNHGRFLLLDISTEDWNMVIINIYAPTKDHALEQIDFLESIQNIIPEYSDKNLVIGGDLNVCLNPQIDKLGGTLEHQSKYAQCLEKFCELLNLTDVWRVLHPDSKKFTRRGHTKSGLVQSRLDYFLISLHMIYDVHSSNIKPGIRSDHSILSVTFNIKNTQQRGKGFWKFNVSLLKDKE